MFGPTLFYPIELRKCKFWDGRVYFSAQVVEIRFQSGKTLVKCILENLGIKWLCVNQSPEKKLKYLAMGALVLELSLH